MTNIKYPLHSFFEDVLKMKYCSGSYNFSEHEKEITSLLIKNGFNETSIVLTTEEKIEMIENNNISRINNGEFISQPRGKNNSPDFAVKCNNKIYLIECKSVNKGHCPIYNGGLPKDNYIYILSSNKYNETTFFYGKNVVTQEMRILYDEYLSKIYEIENILIKKLNDLGEKNPLGISYYVRDMYSHKGKSRKTDYFRHKERVRFEKNVFDSVRQ